MASFAYAQAASGTNTVFRLGVFDGASNEFAGGVPTAPVVADAGSPNFAREWYGVQQALGNETKASADIAAAPRTIRFSLSSSLASAYRLHAAFLIESRSLPIVHICINGKCGNFYLDSPLDAHMGDSDDTFQSTLAPADLTIPVPGSYLRKGQNSITFQMIKQKGDPVPDSTLTYDAVELDTAPAAKSLPASSAAIQPTVFFVGQSASLREIVDVFVRSQSGFRRAGSIQLSVGGKQYRTELRGDTDFGQQKASFEVPEFAANTPAGLKWKIGGRTFHAQQQLDPQKKWTLLLVPHIHLDVGYSDYQPKVAAIQDRAMDEAMDFAARVPGFCYSVDGAWDLAQFMQTRSPSDQQRAITDMRSGKLFVPAEYANLLTGFPTAETLIRSLYASANFSREHGTPFNYADIADVPSYSWSYASILADAGIKYLIAGPNGHLTRGPSDIQGRLNENSPFWWIGPDGNKVLFWYGRHYWEGGILFGVPPLVNAGRATVPIFLKTYERPSYKANAVILFGTQQENTDLFPQQAQLAGEWNREFAYPRIQYSGFAAALKTIAAQFGGKFPTVSGDGGPYWEDGIASDARLAALERQNESRGPSAEKLATLTGIVNPRLSADKNTLDRMWTDMVLMDEHTWTSHDSWSDPSSDETTHQSKIKEMYAVDARQAADYVARNSMADLANAIPAGRNSLIVFNLLNWKRSALVRFDLPKGREIVDSSSGAVVPIAVVQNSTKLTKVQFLAAEVPAFGYKVYKLRTTKNTAPAAPAPVQTTTLQNRFYRIELDPASGAVRSIYDKQLGRELVDQQSPYRFGQYLYVSGGDQRPNTLLQYRTIELLPKLTVDGAHSGRLISVTHEPYGWVARMQSTDTNTPAVTTELRLFDHQKKIEFIEDIAKKAVRTREAVYFAFPFAMDHPQFDYEIQNGVVNPAKNMYPGAGHEWFSVQHWVSVEQNGMSGTVMPLDSSLVTLGDIYRGAWHKQFGVRRGTIFSYAMNNYWSTNYDASQGGHTRLRYVVTSAASTDPVALSRMGWEEATPMELDVVTRQDKAIQPAQSAASLEGSYLQLKDPALLVEDWKPAEDGKGTILRLLDLGGAERQVLVQVPRIDLAQAIQTDAVERNQHDVPLDGVHGFRVAVHPHQIITVRLVAKAAGK